MSYLSVRDSFATMLYTELLAEGIPFNWALMDTTNPNQDRLVLNCVNIYYLDDNADDTLDAATVSVDIIHTNERTAIKWQDTITTKILRKSGIIKNLDYDANPTVPTENYGNIFWDSKAIHWTNVLNDNYVHYNATFDLVHVIPVAV